MSNKCSHFAGDSIALLRVPLYPAVKLLFAPRQVSPAKAFCRAVYTNQYRKLYESGLAALAMTGERCRPRDEKAGMVNRFEERGKHFRSCFYSHAVKNLPGDHIK